MVALLKSGEYITAKLGDLFGVARSTVYRAIGREAARQRAERSERSASPPIDDTTASSIPGSGATRSADIIPDGCPGTLTRQCHPPASAKAA